MPAAGKGFISPTILGNDDVSEVSPDVEFTLRADWNVGDTYRIALSKERQETRFGVYVYTVARSVIDVTVTEKSMSGSVVTWKVTDYERADDSFLYSRDVDAAFLIEEMLEGKPLEIAANRLGFPVSLRNKQEITEGMRLAMDETLARRESDPQFREQLKAGLDRLLTAGTVEALVLEDATAYYGLMGETYRGGAETVYRSRYLPMSGPPAVESKLHVLLREIDGANGSVHVAMRNIADAGQLHQVAVDRFARNPTLRGHPVPYSVSSFEYEAWQIAEYTYDLNKGLATEVMSEKFELGWWSFQERRTFRLMPD
jgi:hypothetical protein